LLESKRSYFHRTVHVCLRVGRLCSSTLRYWGRDTVVVERNASTFPTSPPSGPCVALGRLGLRGRYTAWRFLRCQCRSRRRKQRAPIDSQGCQNWRGVLPRQITRCRNVSPNSFLDHAGRSYLEPYLMTRLGWSTILGSSTKRRKVMRCASNSASVTYNFS
jgi:hypothetical protein